MISSYKEDGMFTSDEEGKLIRRYDELTMEDIDSFNGELEYEIAKMYWYYYVYDEEADLKNTKKSISDNNSGVTASISWLEKALDKKMINKEDENRAAIMLGIASFHKNISVCEKESIDKGMYYEFVCNVKEMIMLIKNEDNDNLKIRFLFKEISGIDSYLLKIKIDGVDRKDIYYICTETDNILKSISEKNISIDDLQKYKKIREILKNIHDKIPEIYEQ